MFIIIGVWLGIVWPSGLISFVPAMLLSFVPAMLLSTFIPRLLALSVSLPYLTIALPMHEFLGKHLCMSSQFPIAILNGTLFFHEMI